MLAIDHVSKKYPGKMDNAVDALCVTIEPGEIFGFIGANGAGKTTTIKMITGILPSDQGTIRIFGHEIHEDPIACKRLIGYVPDDHEVYERLSGQEYLNFIADVYEVDANTRRTRIEEYLHLLDMAPYIKDPIRSYSHGMRQKICLIGSLIHDPKLWILDEPLTGLDPQSAHNLKELMRSHTQKGNIVFFSTHVLEVAERLCTKVGIIASGRLIANGTLEELRARAKATGEKTLEELFLSLVGDDQK